MKKIIFICGVLVSGLGYGAENNHEQAIATCIDLTDLAKSAIDARQRGVPLVEMYKTTIDLEDGLKEMSEIIIDSAYRVPIALTPKQAEIASLEYTNQFFRDCVRVVSGK